MLRQVPLDRDRDRDAGLEYREERRREPVYQYVEERDVYGRAYGGGVVVDEHGRRVERM